MSRNQASPRPGDSTYLLGHADAEIQRCGPGDVSFVASRLVCPTGTVLAVDAADDISEFARTRAAELGASGVCFERTAIADIALDSPSTPRSDD